MTEETLFHEALAKPPAERPAFLEQACAGQPQLRAAVEALVASRQKPGNVLARPPVELSQTANNARPAEGLERSFIDPAATTGGGPILAAAKL